MSEQIYSWLLRLYPSRFREIYREDALQLYRDRARDERGFISIFRLWVDLLRDLATSVPRSYRPAGTAVAAAYHGAPLFVSLEDESLRFASLFSGLVASLAIYTALLFLLSHAATNLPIPSSDGPASSPYAGTAARPNSSTASNTANYSGASVKPTPGVSLSYTPFPPTSGSTVNITAKVFGLSGKPAPGGTVRFFDKNYLLGAGDLNNGTVLLTGKLPDLGQHFLRAVYSGDPNYTAAASFDGARADVSGQAAQAPAAAKIEVKPLTFDVVSIRQDKSEAGPQNVTAVATADGFRARNVSLLSIIQGAYRPSEGSLSFRPGQIIGLPAWASSEPRYDIDAKVAEADLPMWKNSVLQPDMLRTMMQAMLADRCKLVVHRESRVVPIYELTVGRKAPKLKPSDGATLAEIRQKHPNAGTLIGNVIVASGPDPGKQWFFGVTISQLGTLLSNLAGRPVLDKTGLTGTYDVSYQIELRPRPPDGAPPAPPPPPDFFSSQISTIVQDELGLKLKATTGPVESLVIDHIEQPSEN